MGYTAPMPRQPHASRTIASLFIAALILRLIPVLLSYNLGIGLDDMFQYDMLARSLVAGNGYRWYAQADLAQLDPFFHLNINPAEYDARGVLTSFRPPLYPSFLALIYWVFGAGAKRFFYARVAQAVMGAALSPLTFILGRELARGARGVDEAKAERVGRIAGWVMVVYPMFVLYPLAIATENLFFVLISGALLALLKANAALANRARNAAWWFILAGSILGAASLTRSVAMGLSVVVIVWIWFFLKRKYMALAALAAILAVVLPWCIRNSLLHDRPASVETALGYTLYVSYHPESLGTFIYPQSMDLLTIVDDMERDDVGMRAAQEFILADPWRVPELMLRRAGYFFGMERRALTYFYSNDFFGYIPPAGLWALAALLLLPFMVISGSAGFGAVQLRGGAKSWLVAIIVLGYIAPHIVIIAEDRFHLAIVPFLAILAALGWVQGRAGLRELTRTRRGRFLLAAAVLVTLLLIANWSWEILRDLDRLKEIFSPYGNRTHFPY